MGFPSGSNFPGGSDCKEHVSRHETWVWSPFQGVRQVTKSPLVQLGRSPSEGNGNPTPVFLPGEFHGEKILVGYSPWGCKEWNTTEQTNTFNFTFYIHLGSQAPFPLEGIYDGFPTKNQN